MSTNGQEPNHCGPKLHLTGPSLPAHRIRFSLLPSRRSVAHITYVCMQCGPTNSVAILCCLEIQAMLIYPSSNSFDLLLDKTFQTRDFIVILPKKRRCTELSYLNRPLGGFACVKTRPLQGRDSHSIGHDLNQLPELSRTWNLCRNPCTQHHEARVRY